MPPSLDALAREADTNDPPSANRWSDARPEERARLLAAAALTRENMAAQEAEANRPLTPGEADDVALIGVIRTIDRLGARLLSDIDADPPPPLLIDRLDPEAHTILYGTGGCGKGVLTSWWIVELTRAGHRVLILDYENHPGEWSRRIGGLGGVDIRGRVLHAAPLTAAWTGKRGPLWVGAESIRELATEWSATYLIVDSIVPACSGVDPTKPEAAAQYAGALEYLGLPALSLGHVTKADALAYPFGSVFWHNLARLTWSLERDGDGAILTPRKVNNYSRPPRFAVTTTWRNDLPGEVWERPYSMQIADRIADLLTEEPRTVAQLVADLNEDADEGAKVKPNSVRTTLRRGLEPGRFVVDGDRWRAL